MELNSAAEVDTYTRGDSDFRNRPNPLPQEKNSRGCILSISRRHFPCYVCIAAG